MADVGSNAQFPNKKLVTSNITLTKEMQLMSNQILLPTNE